MTKRPRKRKLSKAEAGRIGGRMTARRHGIEHYRAAGKKGFMATVARHWQGDAAGYVRWLRAHGWLAQDAAAFEATAARRASRSRPSPASTTKRRTRPMTNAERRERRREAALKGAATRAAKIAAGPQPAEPFTGPQPARMDLVRRPRPWASRASGHSGGACTELRAGHRPADWTAGQVVALGRRIDHVGGEAEMSIVHSSKSTTAARRRGRGSIWSPWASCWTAPPWASRSCGSGSGPRGSCPPARADLEKASSRRYARSGRSGPAASDESLRPHQEMTPMQITIEIHDGWLGRPEDLRKILTTLAGLECPPTGPVPARGRPRSPRGPGGAVRPGRPAPGPQRQRPVPGGRRSQPGERRRPDDEEEDPPTDGRQLLGWAAKQVPDAKGRVIAVGKKRGYPSRILDWTPQQVAAAYRTARTLARTSR